MSESFWKDDRPPIEAIDARAELFKWMHRHKISGKHLADSVNCSPALISKYLNNKRGLGYQIALRIEAYTRGAISAHSLSTAPDALKSSPKWRKEQIAKAEILKDEDYI